ncbi:type II secretion system F family protein [Streptomyces sp. NPDC051940]|uniref:type II secretion system F family protein n=1 Tax=Streptomyces sp. NPDC051940 TaxID=3155675 RepID=UPI00344400F8
MDYESAALLAVGAALLACALAVAGVWLYAAGRAQRAALIRRLSEERGQGPDGRSRRFAQVDRRVRRTALGRRLERRLAVTGLDVTPGEFTVYVVLLVAAVWIVADAVFAAFFGPVAGVIALWCAHAFLNWQRQRRIEAFINQLPDFSRILANATQAGLALRTALGIAAEELPAPAGEELARVTDQLSVGVSLDEALGDLQDRLPSRELVVLVSTLVLSNRAGGQVVSSLRNLTVTLNDRKETRREVRTQLAQVTLTGYTVPVMGLGSLILTDQIIPGSLDRMSSSALGQGAIILSVGLYAAGILLIRRMARIHV